MRKNIAKWILYGTLCVTIPDPKDAKVIAAKDNFNARNGSTLTTLDYVKLLVKQGVVAELIISAQQKQYATATAIVGKANTDAAASSANVDSTLATENSGW